MNYLVAENLYETEVNSGGNVVLSRKKRYLIFPDGTSLQLGKFSFHSVVHFYFNLYLYTVSLILKIMLNLLHVNVEKPDSYIMRFFDERKRGLYC